MQRQRIFSTFLLLSLSLSLSMAVRFSAPDNDEEVSHTSMETIDFEKISIPPAFDSHAYSAWLAHSDINENVLSIKYLAEYREKTYHLMITLERVSQNKNLIVKLSGLTYNYLKPPEQAEEFLSLRFTPPLHQCQNIVSTCLIIFLQNIVAMGTDYKELSRESILEDLKLVIPHEKTFGKEKHILKLSHAERNYNCMHLVYTLQSQQTTYDCEINVQFKIRTRTIIMELQTIKHPAPGKPNEYVMQTRLMLPMFKAYTAVDLGLSTIIIDFLLQTHAHTT
jgi:hypothetical protein